MLPANRFLSTFCKSGTKPVSLNLNVKVSSILVSQRRKQTIEFKVNVVLYTQLNLMYGFVV